jgi:hypothetical protein
MARTHSWNHNLVCSIFHLVPSTYQYLKEIHYCIKKPILIL